MLDYYEVKHGKVYAKRWWATSQILMCCQIFSSIYTEAACGNLSKMRRCEKWKSFQFIWIGCLVGWLAGWWVVLKQDQNHFKQIKCKRKTTEKHWVFIWLWFCVFVPCENDWQSIIKHILPLPPTLRSLSSYYHRWFQIYIRYRNNCT